MDNDEEKGSSKKSGDINEKLRYAGPRATKPGVQQLTELEDSISAKMRASGASMRGSGVSNIRSSIPSSTTSRPGAQQLTQLEESISAKMRASGTSSIAQSKLKYSYSDNREENRILAKERSIKEDAKQSKGDVTKQSNLDAKQAMGDIKKYDSYSADRADPTTTMQTQTITARSDLEVGEPEIQVKTYPTETVHQELEPSEKEKSSFPEVESGTVDSSLPQETAPGVDFPEQTEGIEAYVAEEEVVDATGVAVVMSQEEEEFAENKRFRKFCRIGLLLFIVIAGGIVAAVVLLLGKNLDANSEETEEDITTGAPSFSPSANRMQAWGEFLVSYSGEEALYNRTSPQYAALEYISENDALNTDVGSARGLQRYILACFYFALNGDKWIECNQNDVGCSGNNEDKSWLRDKEHECDWLGIRCTESKTVKNIFFPRAIGNGLEGYLPSEILGLSDLQGLILHANKLKGTIPEFLNQLEKLEILILRKNELVGTIPEVLLSNKTGNKVLHTIMLDTNQLTGTIPDSVTSLPIEKLTLYDMNLTGTIPPALGELENLVELDLNNNQLTGPIPEELFKATNLEDILLSGNMLSGTLSSKFGSLTHLEKLVLNDNKLTGTIPDELFDTPLLRLQLTNNALSGTLSAAISNANSTIRIIHLQDNNLSGPIPTESIEHLKSLHELILHDNKFTGNISEAICKEKGDFFFDLYNLTVPKTVNCPSSFCCDLQI